MEKLKDWILQSNRWKHLFGGFLIGIFAYGWYCALYTGIGVASSLELKDKLLGGEWDWSDWMLTVIGTAFGQVLNFLIIRSL